ncbi:AMP-binding protein [Vineibacter terrae]|uniref:AMP-binding protein n=1 Tax=Vineibacter terrae TaxID=2586908 RepID=UPI002E375D5E|nr:AMP-binding protein [Vineibacter terrae]HEX2886313.1 AMP-binding protein [Vineibacter terrae]
MFPLGVSYEEAQRRFAWRIPERYNIRHYVCERHPPQALAMIVEDADGTVRTWTYGDMVRASARAANALTGLGVAKGDRVGVFLSQSAELAVSHVACYGMGVVALPLFPLFGEEAVEYRLANAGAIAVITDMAQLPKVLAARPRLPDLRHVIVVGAGKHAGDFLDYDTLLAAASDSFTTVATHREDPALLIYTSGTTGQPKGALHAHRMLEGVIPAMQQWADFWPRGNEVLWTPAEWAWIAGLYDALFPAWYFGTPVLAHRFAKFDPEKAFHLLEKHHVGASFIPPTALKMMRQVQAPRQRWDYAVRTVYTGGEAMGEELLQWGRETFGCTISEGYGQTEMNLMTLNAPNWFEVRPASCGRACVGRRVGIVDSDGNLLPPGEEGQVAGWRHDPVVMLQYWRNPEATQKKFAGDWLLTGDLGRLDADGYLFFKSRDDDVITSGGYRIGPGEIEECLMGHPSVAMAGVVGVPDPVRTEIVKAFVQLRSEVAPSEALKAEIAGYVKTRLAAHEYPREVEFVTEFPLTTTGKIMRRELKRMDAERKAAAKG